MAVAAAISPRLSARPLSPNTSRTASAFSTDRLYSGSLGFAARRLGWGAFALPATRFFAAMGLRLRRAVRVCRHRQHGVQQHVGPRLQVRRLCALRLVVT